MVRRNALCNGFRTLNGNYYSFYNGVLFALKWRTITSVDARIVLIELILI